MQQAGFACKAPLPLDFSPPFVGWLDEQEEDEATIDFQIEETPPFNPLVIPALPISTSPPLPRSSPLPIPPPQNVKHPAVLYNELLLLRNRGLDIPAKEAGSFWNPIPVISDATDDAEYVIGSSKFPIVLNDLSI